MLDILQDADGLELFGAMGLMRAFTSKAALPEYDPANIKGDTWAMGADDFTRRFKRGIGVGPTLMDQVNFQISCGENLHTQTARRIAAPMVAFLRTFVLELEAEVNQDEPGESMSRGDSAAGSMGTSLSLSEAPSDAGGGNAAER